MLAFTHPQGGKNELGEKISTLQGASHQKKNYRGKTKLAYIVGGISLFTLFIKIKLFLINL
jgi:hypothetical protein